MRKSAIAGAVLAAGVSTLVTVAPAQAATYDGRCDSGEVCVYENRGFQGGMADFDGDVNDYRSFSFVGVPWVSLNDNASSLINKANWIPVYLYEHANQSGRLLTRVGPGDVQDQIPYDNQASSHAFYI